MRNARIALLTLVACTALPATAGAQSRIVGGSAAGPGEYPAQAYVSASGFACGGTLVSRTQVATAAHCVDAANYGGGLLPLPSIPVPIAVDPSLVTVYLGSDTAAEGDEHAVSAVTIHPDYDPASSAGDIALLTLDEPATQPALPIIDPSTDSASYAVGRPATVIGWGATAEDGDTSDQLLEVEVPVVSDADCDDANSYDGSLVTDVMLCAGLAAGGKDSCQGDSGGPLMVTAGGSPKLVGIVSFGDGCAQAEKYGVYTEVPAPAIRDFLVEEVGAPPTVTVDPVTGATAGTATILRATAADPTPMGGISAVAWDLDADGAFDDATGTEITWKPTTAGETPVRARATDTDGMVATTERTISVAAAPASGGGTTTTGGGTTTTGGGTTTGGTTTTPAPTTPPAPAPAPAPQPAPTPAPAPAATPTTPAATTPRARLTRVSAKGSRGVLRLTGTVKGSSCSTGRIRVTVVRGGRRVGRKVTKVGSSCSFATSFALRGRLSISIEFLQDGTTTKLGTRTRRVR